MNASADLLDSTFAAARNRAHVAAQPRARIALLGTGTVGCAVLDRLAQALRNGELDADQVATSVVRVLDVKGIDPCEL